ncbi:unnamed protein product, partial [Vitis vinifera]
MISFFINISLYIFNGGNSKYISIAIKSLVEQYPYAIFFIIYKIKSHTMCREAVSFRVFSQTRDSGNGLVFRVMKSAVLAAFTCIFALGGAVVGTITGAIKGQTTETGFFRGSGIGAVTGAITALQLLESVAAGESLSKAALLCSLVNGKVFMEWVSPAVLKAYQWQISTLETNYGETEDFYNISGAKGLPHNFIEKLPKSNFCHSNAEMYNEISCTICLQDFKDGEMTRGLPSCRHYFHMECVDQWLTLHGSCPMCRKDVCMDT